MLSRKFRTYFTLFFVVTSFFCLTDVSQAYGDEKEVLSRVSQAGNSLEAAFLSLLKAERAGGDVSELVPLLNSVLEYYIEANRAIETGEYDEAVLLAGKVVEISNIVLDADTSLLVVTKHVEETAFRNQLFLSFGAILFIILFGFLGWRWFKGYYIRRVMGLRLEVVADES